MKELSLDFHTLYDKLIRLPIGFSLTLYGGDDFKGFFYFARMTINVNLDKLQGDVSDYCVVWAHTQEDPLALGTFRIYHFTEIEHLDIEGYNVQWFSYDRETEKLMLSELG